MIVGLANGFIRAGNVILAGAGTCPDYVIQAGGRWLANGLAGPGADVSVSPLTETLDWFRCPARIGTGGEDTPKHLKDTEGLTYGCREMPIG